MKQKIVATHAALHSSCGIDDFAGLPRVDVICRYRLDIVDADGTRALRASSVLSSLAYFGGSLLRAKPSCWQPSSTSAEPAARMLNMLG